MFNSLTLNPQSLDERPARSSLPRVWIGFIFAAAFLMGEFVLLYFEGDEAGMLQLTPLALGGWIYWLVCVHRFHKILNEVSRNQYPITPAEAVWKHLIPFYNFVWIFRWPAGISEYLTSRGRVTMVSGHLLGLVLLASVLLGRFFDTAIGLAGVFAIGLYISAKMKKHIETLVTADMLPPAPDRDLFGYIQNAPSEATPPLELPS